MTSHDVLISVILMNTHEVSLSTTGADMASLVDAALAEQHDSFLNDLIFHALCSIGISLSKKPIGLSRSDGKLSVGLNLIPLGKLGNTLTVIATSTFLAAPHLNPMSVTAGSAAKRT